MSTGMGTQPFTRELWSDARGGFRYGFVIGWAVPTIPAGSSSSATWILAVLGAS